MASLYAPAAPSCPQEVCVALQHAVHCNPNMAGWQQQGVLSRGKWEGCLGGCRICRQLYIGMADNSISESPMALYRHRRLCGGWGEECLGGCRICRDCEPAFDQVPGCRNALVDVALHTPTQQSINESAAAEPLTRCPAATTQKCAGPVPPCPW